MKTVLAVLIGILFLSSISPMTGATTFTFSQSDLISLGKVGANPDNAGTYYMSQVFDGTTGYIANPDGSVEFIGGLQYPYGNAFAQIRIGKNYPSYLDLSAYDTFQLSFKNTSDSQWLVDLFMKINGHYEQRYPWIKLNPNETATLTYDISDIINDGYNPAQVTQIGFNLGGDMGMGYQYDPSNPDTWRMQVTGSPVPEPATMLLLGSGLVGLAGLARRRFRK